MKSNSIYQGLSEAEVLKSREQHGVNILTPPEKESLWSKFLEKFEDPDVRYYACVVDKNRAGAKPKVVFRLNLAYNSWNELGYLKLKQEDQITD